MGVIICVVGAILTIALFILFKLSNNKHYDVFSFKEAIDLADMPIITFYNNNRKFNYMIYRDCLLTKGAVILTYRRSAPIVDADGFIDFPFSFFDFVVECIKISLTKGADELSKYITDNAMKMLPARKYSNARVKLPWRV